MSVALRKKVAGTCAHCGGSFGGSLTSRKYCSRTCRQYAYEARHPERRQRKQAARPAAPEAEG